MKTNDICAHITIKNKAETIYNLDKTFNEAIKHLLILKRSIKSLDENLQNSAIAYGIIFNELWTKTTKKIQELPPDVVIDYMDGKNNVN